MIQTKRPVIVTRPEPEAQRFCALLEGVGISAQPLPLIECVAAELSPEEGALLREVPKGRFSTIVFTSPRGVAFFASALKAGRHSVPETTLFAAQGKKTAEWVRRCLNRDPAIMPSCAVSDVFADCLASAVESGSQILVVRPERARGILQQKLRQSGFSVHELSLYRTLPVSMDRLPEPGLSEISQKGAFVVCFSPSAVRRLVRFAEESQQVVHPLSVAEWKEALRCAAFGPVTAAACRELNVSPVLEHGRGDSAAFAHEIARYLAK